MYEQRSFIRTQSTLVCPARIGVVPLSHASLSISIWGVHFEEAKEYGGDEGRGSDGQPVESANGYDDGEWMRLVQDFPNLPTTPGSRDFPIKLTSSWGVVCDVYASLTVTVIEGPHPTCVISEGP